MRDADNWAKVFDAPGHITHTSTHADTLFGHAALLTPDTMLPIQWQAEHGKSQDLTPEQRLLQAMLEDALECFSACPGIRQGLSYSTLAIRKQYEAEKWIFEPYTGIGFSFEFCCEHLDIDPNLIREKLKPWRTGNQPKLRFPNGYVVTRNRTLVEARARNR